MCQSWKLKAIKYETSLLVFSSYLYFPGIKHCTKQHQNKKKSQVNSVKCIYTPWLQNRFSCTVSFPPSPQKDRELGASTAPSRAWASDETRARKAPARGICFNCLERQDGEKEPYIPQRGQGAKAAGWDSGQLLTETDSVLPVKMAYLSHVSLEEKGEQVPGLWGRWGANPSRLEPPSLASLAGEPWRAPRSERAEDVTRLSCCVKRFGWWGKSRHT